MATLQSWRKAVGALKDTTTVSLANLNSEFKDLDVAIVKATNHAERPPKERHIRKIFAATSITRPRADVAHCINALARRLSKTHSWTVALKILTVIHRTLRDGDPTFREELLNFSQRVRIFQLANFKDDSSPIAWDCSAWVRTYALFLEERLECFRILRYDVEAEHLVRPAEGSEKGYSQTRKLDSHDLLEQLPALQQLLHRLIGCRPEVAAINNYIVQYALALVLKESFKIYCAINDGIINLVDKLFEMSRHEAIRALEIYRRAGQQAKSLSGFYEVCRGLQLTKNFQFPNLREPPQSFIETMEEYIREAPRMVSVSTEPLEYPERLLLTYKVETVPEMVDDVKTSLDESESAPSPIEVTTPTPWHKADSSDTVDFFGLSETNTKAPAVEENNSLALAIDPASTTTDLGAIQDGAFDPTGWELAPVTTLSNNNNSTVLERKMAGGFDKLALDSLYDEAAYKQHQQLYEAPSSNPFMVTDPFAMSNQIATPAVQMASMAQQQQQMFSVFVQSNPFAQPIAPLHGNVGAAVNPFGDDAGLGTFSVDNLHHEPNNPFGNPLV